MGALRHRVLFMCVILAGFATASGRVLQAGNIVVWDDFCCLRWVERMLGIERVPFIL
jgi:hypothetical protein